jgi:hypothetical protein
MEFNIENTNKIAKFMGYQQYISPFWYHIKKSKPFFTKFDNWNELHQIIDKIESFNYKVTLFDTQCQIETIFDTNQYIIWEFESTKFEATYKAILIFIDYYDKITNK